MPPLIAGIAYVSVCLMCRGAGKWKPTILPHCAMASAPQYALVVIAPIVLVLVFLTVGGTLLNVKWWWFVEVLSMSALLGLTLDAVRRLTNGGLESSEENSSPSTTSEFSTEGSSQPEETPQYVLVSATEPILIKMEADFQLSNMMGKTPFAETRIASVEALGAIQNVSPTSTIIPWPEELNEKIFAKHAEKDQLCKEKIAEAMALETGKMAATLENKEIKAKLGEALEANKKYEKVLQDLRSKPSNVASDYAKMTPSQRGEEEKRLREALQKMQELSKKPTLAQVSIPSYFKQPGALD